MIPAEFEYVRAETLQDAVAHLARLGDRARPLAGGHSLLPLMRLRLAAPQVLVDIGRLRDLAYVRQEGADIAVGALTTHAEVEASALLVGRGAALADAAGVLGDVQVRHRGTLGGELCHADPAADYAAAVLALGGRLRLVAAGGERELGIDQWYRGPFLAALAPTEILTEYRFPATGPGEASVYRKFARRACDYGITGVAVRLRLEADGRCGAARVALTCVGDSPYRAEGVEAALRGRVVDAAAAAEAASLATEGVHVAGDALVPADYRAHLARVETRRAIEEAARRARDAAAAA